MNKNTQKIDSLFSTTQNPNQPQQFDKLLNDILDLTLQIFKAKAGLIRIFDEETRELVLKAHKGFSLKKFTNEALRKKYGEGKSWECIQSGRPLITKITPNSSICLENTEEFPISISIPLKSKTKLIGSLILLSHSPDHFKESELELFSNIGNQVGGSIENARRRVHFEQQTQSLTAMYAISQTVNQSLDLDQVLNDALDKVMDLFKPHSSHIRLLDDKAQELVLAAQKGLTPEESTDLEQWLKLKEDCSHLAIKSGKAVVIEDILTDPRTAGKQSFAKKIGCRTLVTLPLYAKDKLVGNMSIRSLKPSAFDAGEIQLFTSIGQQIGIAIQNANLFAQVEQRTRALAALNAISQTVNQSLDLDQVLNDALDKVMNLYKLHSANIRFVDSQAQELVLAAHKGLSPEELKNIPKRLKPEEGAAGLARSLGEIVIIEDLLTDPRTKKFHDFSIKVGCRSLVILPLYAKDKLVGMMSIRARNPRSYTPEEIQVFTSIGQQIGTAIENAQLYQDKENTIKKLKETQARLQRSNDELTDFAYIASHDLQEPLRKVQTFGDRLKTKCAEGLNEAGRDYIERMQNAAGRMNILINGLLAYSRVTTKAQPFITVDIKTVVREVISDLEVRIEQLQAQIDVGELPVIEADPLQMRQLFQNLIGNALKFHRDGVAPRIHIYSRCPNHEKHSQIDAAAPNGFCKIFVQDNGIGFEEKYTERIFAVFHRLHGNAAYEGSGIGLSICRKISERHGGVITAKSTPGEGSLFIVSLPTSRSLKEIGQKDGLEN